MDPYLWIEPKVKLKDPVASIRKNRGFSDDQVLPIKQCRLEDPFLFPEMEVFVKRLKQAAKSQEKVLVLSDFDMDGASCAALAQNELTKYLNLKTLYPDRYIDGYSVNRMPKYEEGEQKGQCLHFVEMLATNYYKTSVCRKVVEAEPSLLIMADIGVRNWAEVAFFQSIGIEVLIIDHHEPGDRLPDCPMLNHHTCEYPAPLSAGGIFFKLLQALFQKGWKEIDVLESIIIAGASVITDMVPTTHSEIRCLMYRCIKLIQHSKNAGIQKLLQDSRLKQIDEKKRDIRKQMQMIKEGKDVEGITESDIGFYIGPRINATGRLYSVATGVSALAGDEKLAHDATLNNEERKFIQKVVYQYHRKQVDESNLFHLQYANNEEFDLEPSQQEKVGGVNGIAAQNIVQMTGKPAAVGSQNGDEFTFSLRSVPGLSILELLEEHSELINNFGGHAAAAGMKVSRCNLELLQQKLNHSCAKKREEGVIFQRHFYIDYEVQKMSESLYYKIYEQLGPYGQGNPTPIFVMRNQRIYHKPQLCNENAFRQSGECSLVFRIEGVPFAARYYGSNDFRWIRGSAAQALDIAFELAVDKGSQIHMRILDICRHV